MIRPSRAELELAPNAFELVSVGIAADHDGGALGQAQIALAQRYVVALGEPDELGDCPMHQPRVGRMRNCLGLYRGIDHHALQVLGTDGASLVRHRQTFLDQRDELFLAEPLAPACHRRSIERQPVAEAQFAAEVLVIGVSIQRAHSTSSDRSWMCFRMNRPATSRVGRPGCPDPVWHTELKRSSRTFQSISAANRTSG